METITGISVILGRGLTSGCVGGWVMQLMYSSFHLYEVTALETVNNMREQLPAELWQYHAKMIWDS